MRVVLPWHSLVRPTLYESRVHRSDSRDMFIQLKMEREEITQSIHEEPFLILR